MTNENEYARKMKSVGKKLKSLRYGLRESLGLSSVPFRETFKDSRPKLINLAGNETPQSQQQTQPQPRERVIMVNEEGEYIGEVPQEDIAPTQNPTQQPQRLIPNPPQTQQNMPSVREKVMNFQGGGLMKNFKERPIRKSLGGLIDSISSNIRSQPQPQNIPKPRPQPQKEEPKEIQTPEISFELDGQKSKDKRSEHSLSIED